MAPYSQSAGNAAAAPRLSTTALRPGPRVWEVLPAMAYDFMISINTLCDGNNV
jgi:hypothetical protein